MRYWFLLLIYIVCLPSAAIELPDIGLSANTVMSPADEQKLGETFLRQIRREVNVIDAIQISNYFNALGHRLASYSNAPAQNFYFFTIFLFGYHYFPPFFQHFYTCYRFLVLYCSQI